MMKAKTVLSISCLVILFSFIIVSQTLAAEWILYNSNISGDMYYNKTGIKKDKNMRRVWTKIVFSDDEKIKAFSLLAKYGKAPDSPDKIGYMMALYEIDCVKTKMRTSSATYYDVTNLPLISSSSTKPGEWEDIIPETAGEELQNRVCSVSRK